MPAIGNALQPNIAPANLSVSSNALSDASATPGSGVSLSNRACNCPLCTGVDPTATSNQADGLQFDALTDNPAIALILMLITAATGGGIGDLRTLLSSLAGGARPPAGGARPPVAQPPVTIPPAVQNQAVRRDAAGNVVMRGINDPALQRTMNQLASDPEGALLIAEAQRLNVGASVGNTGGANILGFFQPSTNNLVVGNGTNMKTLAHELVHAVSRRDGNSRIEETTANILGFRIVQRLTGAAAPSVQTLVNRTVPLYQDIQRANGIRATLASIGINAPDINALVT
jgi:hypothetical protein